MKSAFALLAISGLAASASAQVVISEVWENPPGDGDVFDPALEYIELYGEPGMDLTGYAIASLKGGSDPNGDGIPSAVPEIDEAFSLDGLSIGANGFLVIYNNTGGLSDIPFLLPPGAASVGFNQAHIPSTDVAGKLANDDSSSYVLVRGRANHSVVGGASVYGPGYAFRKDINPDVDFDGKIDFGNETPVVAGSARQIDPLQQIDDVAWSNGGGKEYVRSSEQEISDTPGFNPDAISRVAYYGANPNLGLRLNSEGATVPTRMADEEWIYGEQGPNDGDFTYLPGSSGAPTDPNGDGFQDLDVTGFAMTPGGFNDGGAIAQFRFVRGDFDFNGLVDSADGDLIEGKLGEHLDVLTDCLDEFGNPVVIFGQTVQCYLYEGRTANALLAMMNMDKTDGTGGANAASVTQSDIDAWNDEFGVGGCNPADIAEPFGLLDLADIIAFTTAFVAQDSAADIDPNGIFDLQDINAFVTAFLNGCP
jgi:hypothetical protein